MNERFVALLKVQLNLETKLRDVQRRIGQALKAERDKGNDGRILIDYEGIVYGLARPLDEPLTYDPYGRWEFRLEARRL